MLMFFSGVGIARVLEIPLL